MRKSAGQSWSKLVKGGLSKKAKHSKTTTKLVPYTLSHRTPRTPELPFCLAYFFRLWLLDSQLRFKTAICDSIAAIPPIAR